MMTKNLKQSFRKTIDPDYYKWCQQQYEEIRQRRNSFHGKPDQYELMNIRLDRIFERFYRSILSL